MRPTRPPFPSRPTAPAWAWALNVALTVALAVALTVGVAPAQAQGPAGPGSRGQMLYGNHCIACHTTQMHWRDQKLVTDWASLKLQVRRWQGTAQLNWSEDDIDDVARYLNDTFYRLPGGAKVASAPLSGPVR